MQLLDLLLADGGRGFFYILAALLVVMVAVGYPLARRRERLLYEAAAPYQRALDERAHGWALTEPPLTDAAYAWVDLPLPHERKLTLIADGVTADEALDPATVALDDGELRILAALSTAATAPKRR